MKWERKQHLFPEKKNLKIKEFHMQFQKKKLNEVYCNLRHGTERKRRSVIFEREIFNLQTKNPCRTPLYGRMWGSIRNLKAVAKSSTTVKPQKKIRSEPKTAWKTVKTDKCSYPSSQNPNRSDTVLTSGAYRGFPAVRDQWRRYGRLDRRENGIQTGQSENFIGNQIRSPLDRYFRRKSRTKC